MDRISESLNRFKSTKLYPFITSLESPGVLVEPNTSSTATKGACSTTRYRSRATAHLESMINCAESKYKEWNERRRK
ncbi:unnamed protein product [Dibothriocephalus latus]|uniref:Uncharacterized protein n=1 Tax=Dibothriocephalus latus TaxID=60516 RepID=A0A3P7MF85_DIBLA|nr:unnamed protein product [Dibothriocephalus latus]